MTTEHHTKIVRHAHVNCHTSRTWPAANGDCGTRFEACCSCGFAQGASCQEQADVIERGHVATPEAQVIAWDNTPLTAETITDQDLRDLFARHCECRPLDLSRSESDHAAVHDCDTAILRDVQLALGLVVLDDQGRGVNVPEARGRCAAFINEQRAAGR